MFTNPPVYHWYLSATAIFLNASWSLHNVIAWMKNKPFLGRKASLFYISTVILVQPYWVIEIVANVSSIMKRINSCLSDIRQWLYFGNYNNLFIYTRPYEALFRDPWWIFTVLSLFWNIKTRYEFSYLELLRVSPRFGVLLGAMILSICFIFLDILAVTHVIDGKGLPDGINPFWKLAFVFKCLTDTIVLDDFKTALDKLKQYKLQRLGGAITDDNPQDFVDVDQVQRKKSDPLSNGALALPSSYANPARDWSKAEHSENIDLEAALRMDSGQIGEASKP